MLKKKYLFIVLLVCFLCIAAAPKFSANAVSETPQITLYDFVGHLEIEYLNVPDEYLNEAVPVYSSDSYKDDYLFDMDAGFYASKITYIKDFADTAYLISINGAEFTELEEKTYTVANMTSVRTAVIKAVRHTVSFSYDGGGKDVEVIDYTAVKAGDIPEPPEREGYTFGGWLSVETDGEFDFSQPVTADVYLYADYAEVEQTVYRTVGFYDGDTFLSELEVADGERINSAPEPPVKDGYTFVGWREKDAEVNFDFALPVTKDVDLVAYYEKDPVFIPVFFYDADGGVLASFSVEEGEDIPSIPEPPEIEGYDFIGWREKDSETDYDFLQELTGELRLYAYYEPKPAAVFNVVFLDYDSAPIYSEAVELGKKISQVPENPSRDGHEFIGWREVGSDANFDLTADVYGDITLYAYYEADAAVTYNVSFYDNGVKIASVTVTSGENAPNPPNPVGVEGYTFISWRELSSEVNFDLSAPIEADKELYAFYEKNKYTITFVLGNGDADVRLEVYYGEAASPPSAPYKEDYEFTGWNGDYTNVKTDVTITAVYKLVYIHYTFIHRDTSVEKFRAEIGTVFVPPLLEEREGFTAAGWSDAADGELYDFSEKVAESSPTVFYCVYGEVYFSVIFRTADGTFSETESVRYGQKASPKTPPEKEGYTFKEWRGENQKAFDFDKPVKENITLYAFYEVKLCYIRFYDRDDFLFLAAEYSYGEESKPYGGSELVNGYKKFLGWFTDKQRTELFVFGNPVTEDIELYILFSEEDYCTVTYYADGQKVDWDFLVTEIIRNGSLGEIPKHEEIKGYTFSGWFADSLYHTEFLSDTAISTHIKLYGYYYPTPYAINIRVSDGVQVSVNSHAVFDEVVGYEYTLPKGYKIAEHRVIDLTTGEDIDNADNTFIMPYGETEIVIILDSEKYSVIVEAEGNEPQYTRYGELPVLTPPEKENLYFIGWFTDAELSKEVTAEDIAGEEYEVITLYPAYVPLYYNVTIHLPELSYDVNGELFAPENPGVVVLIYTYGETIEIYDQSPFDIEGHTFTGLYSDAEKNNPFGARLTADRDYEFFAEYAILSFEIAFVYGENLTERIVQTVNYRHIPDEPDIADYPYLRFKSWSPAIESVCGDTTFYAVYDALYDNYYLNGDELVAATRDTMSLIPSVRYTEPAKSGYIFTGFEWIRTENKEIYYRAVFVLREYSLDAVYGDGIEINLQKSAARGKEVEFFIYVQEGYELKEITITPACPYTSDGYKYGFIMPESNVVIRLDVQKVKSEVVLGVDGGTDIRFENYSNLGDGVTGGLKLSVSSAALGKETTDYLIDSGIRLKNLNAFEVSLVKTAGGKDENIDFAFGNTVKILLPITNADAEYTVMFKSESSVAFYNYRIVIKDGVKYLEFIADRTGVYAVGEKDNVSETDDNKGNAAIIVLASALAVETPIILFFVIRASLKKKKREI